MTILPQSTNIFDTLRRTRPDGSEFWSGRDLMGILGYSKWQAFFDALGRAQAACENSGHDASQHFLLVSVKSEGRPATDMQLSRYACYLTAMNADARKEQVALAQTYFAAQTRAAEVVQAQALEDDSDPLLAQLALLAQVRRRQIAAERQLEQHGQAIAQVQAELAQEAIKGAQISTIYKLGQQLGQLMGGTPANRASAWRLFKARFDLASYRDLPRCQFDEGVRFLTLQLDAYNGRPEPLLGGDA